MVLTPSGFTYEHLSNLKFKELQKLSVQFRVNKRWAKKQELIDNLLAIKPRGSSDINEIYGNKESEEWQDGSIVFQDLKPMDQDNNIVDKRLTFNVDKSCNADSRLTFDVLPKEENLICENTTSTNSRETYDVPQKASDFNVEPLRESRATYEIAQKEPLLPCKVDSRATYNIPQNDNEEFGAIQKEIRSSEINDEFPPKRINVEQNLESSTCTAENPKSLDLTGQSKVKMLTIPYTRLPRRNKKDLEKIGKHNSALTKLSHKSINIKKAKVPQKQDIIKSPITIRKPVSRQQNVQSVSRLQMKNVAPSKIPTILSFTEQKLMKPQPIDKPNDNDKENANSSRILRRRKSKTADEVLIKKSNVARVNFMSPTIPLNKNHNSILPLNKTPMNKDDKDTKKPITAKKMPDFNKIHQKQFAQMDSLPDYLKKKEERTRKLFGTPLQTSQQKTLNTSTLFKFNSSAASKFGKSSENLKNIKGTAQKESVKSRLPPSRIQMDVKDKSRNHIIGVRTNKRFELQMKLRNL